ncbi:MAG TPA: hypothetical protein PKK99_12865, partial [Bacteroidia bacterium]|nr:hypothetical protein [Bacteroidia bacterium]
MNNFYKTVCLFCLLISTKSFSQTSDYWEQKTDFSGSARTGAVGFNIGSKGYIGLGQDVNGFNTDWWEFDPVANTWTQKANFPGSGRVNAAG